MQEQNKKDLERQAAGLPDQRRPYEKPVLIAYGDVRDVTLGPTAGLAESGAELTRRN